MSTTSVNRRVKLGRHSNGRLMTPQEFDAVRDYDDLYRYELVHGVLIVSPFAGIQERDPNEELGRLLRNYQDAHPQGSVIDTTVVEHYLNVPDGRRRADRVAWTGLGRLPEPETDVPTIVVEFVSKSTRDRVRDYVEKRREYLELGVREYWVIDRFKRTMTVFRKAGDGPEEVVVQAGSSYHSPLLPGFELPLGRLLTLANRWKKGRPT